MKKIANFIVNRRYIALAAVLLLTVMCAFLTPMVKINTDMTKYLSDASEMKNGIDLMADEFPDAAITQTIRVMFTGLDDGAKADTLEKLSSIENVVSVDYDAGSADYNNGDKTLYILNTEFDYGSREEKAIEKTLDNSFAYNEMTYANDDTASSDIPMSILITIAVLLMIILFATSRSWIEPFLFVAAIGSAIVINLGTNIFMGSISDTTLSIAAILQLVLSMDYSIILMNRYRQELKLQSDPAEAMKTAWVNALSSIWGSALTTVVGLLALVFMSFKIGADIGIVLAKGVLISMICVLALLPALILIFNNLIAKTEKPSLHLPTGGLASFCYKARRVIPILFVALFVGSYFLQTATDTAYTLTYDDTIKDYFTSSNTVVLLYGNSDEEKAAELAKELSDNKSVKSVTSYSTTLGNKFTAEEMSDNLTALGSDSESALTLDPSLLSLVYYDFAGGKVESMTLGEFFGFVSGELSENELFKDYFDDETLSALDQAMKYTDKTTLTTAVTPDGLAEYFGMSPEQVKQLLAVYYSNNGGVDAGTMTLGEFCAFLSEKASDPAYSQTIDDSVKARLATLSAFSDKATITRPMTSDQLAELFGMDKTSVAQLFAMTYGENAASATMTPYDFTGFMLTNVLSNPALSGSFDSSAAESLGQLQSIMDVALSDAALTPEQLSQLVGMDAGQLESLYLVHTAESGDTSAWLLSPKDFLDFLVNGVLTDQRYSAMFDDETSASLISAQKLTDAAVSDQKLTSGEMYSLLESFGGISDKLSESRVGLLYLFYSSQKNADSGETMTIGELIGFIRGTMAEDERFGDFLDADTLKKLDEYRTELDDGAAQLTGDNYSRMIIETTLPSESEDTFGFIESLHTKTGGFSQSSYLIGSMEMTYELKSTFGSEQLFITLLTAIAIFVVVALTFRSLVIPVILVLIVQCGVFITVAVIGLQGYSVYYLALLMVQCILMGATIDYGILFSNYYREKRASLEVKEALAAAYEGSINTVMTSGLIMILITGVLGFFFNDPVISQICRTISIGALSVVLLILFALPGMLAAFDKVIVRKSRLTKKNNG